MRTIRYLLVGSLVCFSLGCGSDSPSGQGDGGGENTSPDAGPTDTASDDNEDNDDNGSDASAGDDEQVDGGGSEDTAADGESTSTDDAGSSDASSSNDTSKQDTGPSGGPSCLKPKFQVDDPQSCETSSGQKPSRCEADLLTFDKWGPVSLVSKLELISDEAKNDTFNLDQGEGPNEQTKVDNNMAALLENFSLAGVQVDNRVQQNIEQGELLLALEYQGVSSYPPQGDFAINPATTVFADANEQSIEPGTPYLVEPPSFSSGAFPKARFDTATINNGKLSTEAGNLTLRLQLGIFKVSVPVRGARLEADVDTTSTDVAGGKGISLENGRLGGYVLVRDVFEVLNDLFQQCSCLENPSSTFQVPDVQGDDPDLCKNKPPTDCSTQCKQAVEERQSNCSDQSLCGFVKTTCGLTGSITRLADLDTDCDGYKDALSLGAVLEAKGGTIAGPTESVTTSNKQVSSLQSGSTVTIDSAFLKEKRWVAVYDDDQLVGYSQPALSSGQRSDISVTLTESLQSGDELRAVLHAESNGNSSFDYPNDTSKDQPVTNPQGETIADSFVVRSN